MISKIICVSALVLFSVSCTPRKTADKKQQEASYYIGVQFVQSLQKQGTELDEEKLLQGISDALAKKNDLPSEEDVHRYMVDFYQSQQQHRNVVLEEKEQAALQYLEQIKTDEKDLVTLSEHIYFKALKKGEGKTPKLSNKVMLRYRGSLPNGEIFVDQLQSMKPETYSLVEVIPGWRESLLQMKEGDLYRLYLSPKAAYGARGTEKVPPASAVIYDLELVRVLK